MASDEAQYLSREELDTLKSANFEERLRTLNVAIMERDIQLLNAQAEIAKQKSEVVRHRLLIMKQEHDDARQRHIDWWGNVKTRLGVKDDENVGYSPESGLVTITKKEG